MYANFYNLKKEPFHITPDPEFLFLSPSHKEALGAIIYGVKQRKGFISITGEVGVGKTTIVRSYLEQVEKKKLKIIYVFNSNVTFAALLKTIFQEMGVVPLSEEVYDMVNQLHELLIEEYRNGCNVVLIIDEAQNMPVETLENLRMLSNLETSTDKLIQIIFSSQPEFQKKLDMKELRQLKQRIAVKATIQPLSAKESLEYIRHRIGKVSSETSTIFSVGALEMIVREAKGIPRVINILCENSLITAMGYKKKCVSSRVAKEVIADFTGFRKKMQGKRIFAYVVAGAIVVCASVGYYYRESLPFIHWQSALPESRGKERQSASVIPPQETRQTEVLPAEKAAPVPKQKPETTDRQIVKVVKKGDTLSALIAEVYGISNGDLITHVKTKNGWMRNPDRIEIGERIIFPPREKGSGNHE